MAKMTAARSPVRERSETGTDSRILESAITLFAERGFSEVTVRDIAEHAKANPAAISYYFGAKEQLIKQAIRAVLGPLNEKRLAALDALEANGAPASLEDVVRAMIEPTVRACMGGDGADRFYARILVLTFALRQPFVDEVMSEQTDKVATRFVNALMRALPGSTKATMFWHYDFMIGALSHILLDASRGYRLRHLSGGDTDTSVPNAVIEHLVGFIAAGMTARTPTP